MAEVGGLNFQGFVEARVKATPSEGRQGGRAYAYVSDHKMRRAFELASPLEAVATASVRFFEAYSRTELLGKAVKVGPRQFPRVHSLTRDCANTLGIQMPTVYIVNSPVMNAATFGTNEESVIMVHSALVDHFTDAELLSVIGHECGHIHNDHVVFLTALHYLRFVAGALLRYILAPAELAMLSWVRRAEITCDRAGLLCARDLDVSTRALTKLALGSSKLYDQLNMDAFLEQYEEMKTGFGRVAEANKSHPFLPKRVIALKFFAESELYRTHAGIGAGGLSMDEVDEKTYELVKVWGD
ncbi:MAG: M48 family metallopeptidase [Polyangiaceae bacterium]